MATFSGDIYLNTRVSFFARSLLTDEQIEQLPRLKFDDLTKSYGLTSVQDGNAPVSLRLKALESALVNILLNELVIVVRPMYPEACEMIMFWARKFELFNLKALIRGKLSGISDADIRATLHDLPAFLALPHQSLLGAESVLELLRQLENGQYKAIASQARKSYEEHRELFLLDAAIDRLYCTGMAEQAQKLKGIDRREVTKIVGWYIDRLTLLWLLRYRFNYNLAPSDAYYHLVPSPLYMKKDQLLSLVNLSTWEEVIEALPEGLNQELAGVTSIAEVERRMHAMNLRNLHSMMANDSRSVVARSLAYLMLRDLDSKRLITVVQSHLLGLDVDLLYQALGLQAPNAASPTAPLPTAA
jgi:V/A-type H+-transporting ATPase subunit C